MDTLPESNGDNVALNLVVHAIVDEINTPGEALAGLLDRMAAMSRDIGGDFRVATADWHEMLKIGDEIEIKPVVDRQAQAMGDSWAKRWLLCLMFKRLYEDLEHCCLNHPAATKLERVTYAEDGTLESWSLRGCS